ncbi:MULTISPECIES: HAD family hydrolase [Bacteria]
MSTANPPADARHLHVFDMDGTLLRSSATIELARQMGRLETGLEIEGLWREGMISDTDFWLCLLEICANATAADLEAAFENAPWMDGIAGVFADIRSRGEAVIVISQSPTFFVRGLERWGAHETYGSAVEVGTALSSSATLLAETKVTITESALAGRGLSADDCVVYGDSSSDVWLFKTYSQSVAVNPTPALAALAASSYIGSDIREAYALGRGLLDASTRRQLAQGSTS